MDITVACPRCSKRYRIHESETGKHVCPDCHTATVVPGAPVNPARATANPAAPSNSTVAPSQNTVTPPQPKPAQQPSPASQPIRNTTTPTHVAPADENTLKSAEIQSARKMLSIGLVTGGINLLMTLAKSGRKKPSIGLLVGGGIGLLVLIAVIAIALIPRKPEVNRPVLAQHIPTKSDTTNSDITIPKTPKDPEQIAANCAGSVAFIKGRLGSGSGFVVSRNVIATNSHVIRREFDRNLEIHFPSASSNEDKGPFHAQLVFEDAKRDLAFLSVRTKLPPLKGAESFEFHPGMSITIIGSPAVGDGVVKNAVSIGVLSAKDRRMDQDFYQLGASVNPGNSGGPVFDKYGEVIGVATLKARTLEGISWCIPVDDLRSSISRVSSQSREIAAESGSRHRLRVVCRLLTMLGSVLADGMDGYIEAMLDSIKNKQDPKEGLSATASKFVPLLKRREDILKDIGLKDEIAELSSDPATDRQSRQQLLAMWETIQQMKALLDRPTSPPLAFANDAGKLKTIFIHQSYLTQFRLGIPADED